MSRSAQNKAMSAEEPTCAVCGVQGGHAPGCWVGQSGVTEAPVEEPKDEPTAEEKKDEE